MSKEIEYTLKYREKGEKKTIDLKIDFSSNYCIRKLNEIMQVTEKVRLSWSRMQGLAAKKSALKTEQPTGYKELIKATDKEIRELTEETLALNGVEILKERFELTKQLLEDNGYREEFLFDYDFWDRQVDPLDNIEFLALAIYKDLDEKKNKETTSLTSRTSLAH